MPACHGEDDFASPNLSWMLVGQAYQQAKAISLHMPGNLGGDEPSRQRRLCLFWSLYVADKSVSLAFGQPEFLEGSHYDDVPLPDESRLKMFLTRP